MDRSIIVLMKSVKITFCVQKFKNFGGGWGIVSRTGDFLPSRGRRLNILRKIKKRRLKLHFKCCTKIFLACHLKRITQAVISDKKFKFRFGTNAFWDTSCNDLIHVLSPTSGPNFPSGYLHARVLRGHFESPNSSV